MGIVGPEAGLFDVGEPMATRVGYAGMNGAGNTAADAPLAYSLLDSLPGAATTTAWNIGRVNNTIIHGGTAGRLRRRLSRGTSPLVTQFDQAYGARRGMGGMFGLHGGGISQTLGPRHMRRLTRAANIDPSFYGQHSGIYTPFNSLSSIGNTLFRKAESRLKGNAAARVEKMVGSAPRVEGENMFSPGTLGRVRSMGAMTKMSGRKFGQKAINIRAAIQDLNPEYYAKTFVPGLKGLEGAGMDVIQHAYASGIGSTINGRLSGRFAGYVRGAESAAAGAEHLAAAKSMAMEGSHFASGLEAGAKAFQESSRLGKIVGSGAVSGALKAVNVAGWIMLAHDVASGAGKLIGAGVKGAFGAAQSTLGSINKGVMGMGFKDNTVAATSRQRGVMAIQNSRLNARSLLGSEGAMMAAHFG